MHRRTHRITRLVGLATAYDEQSGEAGEFVIPEDLTALSGEELTELHEQAVSHFDSIYGDGQGLSEDDLAALAALTEGIETLQAEIDRRAQAESERAEQAAALAARVRTEHSVQDEEEGEDDGDDEDDGEDADEEETDETEDEGAASTVSAAREVRVNLSSVSRRSQRPPAAEENSEGPQRIQDVLTAAGEGTGYSPGQGIDWNGVGRIVSRRLDSYSHAQYAAAARAGKHLRQQFSVATINKHIPDDLVISRSDPEHVDEVIRRAVDQSRLPGGSLVAAGGWCAPNTVIYDLLELESRDGIFSLPTVGWARGGISRTLGPDFSDIFSANIGWDYSEAEDIDGDYDGEGGGEKPCYRIDCPEFEDFRLRVAGLCLQAGLLQARGYPEMIARVTRGALVAHDHRMAGKRLAAVEAGSTAVTMPAAQQGAVAPLLTAIELQVEHYRNSTRISRGTTLEAVFPYWVLGALRSDLSRRNGVDLISVTDAQIIGWFATRGVAPQFVYNWQDISGTAAGSFTQWPTTVKFLLYAAGAWIEGTSDVITLDTIYDSQLLGQNDYTALFTEEGYEVVKMHHDSRVVTVPVCPDGSTGDLVPFDCDGTAIVPDAG